MKAIKNSVRAFCAVFALFSLVSPAVAAPITLAFEAEIDRLSGAPFDSGIEFSVGDLVYGEFSVDPANGDGNMSFESMQPHAFDLNINGIELSAPAFEIFAVNNSPISDFPLANVIDSLSVTAGGLSPVQPDLFPNIDAESSGFRMTLRSQPDAFSQASIPGTAAIWNNFDLRKQLGVTFRDGNGAVVGFQATIRQFVAVPEPATRCWALLFVVPIMLRARAKG